MQYPNDGGVFTLETDASAQTLGYILYQSRSTGEDGKVACGEGVFVVQSSTIRLLSWKCSAWLNLLTNISTFSSAGIL